MKRTDPKSLASIIDEALRASNLDREAAEHRASYVWAEVMGPGITRYTARRFVINGVLHVYLTSAPLKNELSFHRERIVKLINEAVGSEAITDLAIH